MDDSAAGGHELEIAFVDCTFVAGEVFVVDGAFEEVGYCFLTTAGKEFIISNRVFILES